MSGLALCPDCGGHMECIYGHNRCFTDGCPNQVDGDTYEHWEEEQWTLADQWYEEHMADWFEEWMQPIHVRILVPVKVEGNVTTWTSQAV